MKSKSYNFNSLEIENILTNMVSFIDNTTSIDIDYLNSDQWSYREFNISKRYCYVATLYYFDEIIVIVLVNFKLKVEFMIIPCSEYNKKHYQYRSFEYFLNYFNLHNEYERYQIRCL